MVRPSRGAGPEGARPAVRLVARVERRERRWSLLVLGLVLGIVGGGALGAVALGERTGSAYSRLVDTVHLDDVRTIVPADQPRTIEALPNLPGVADVWLPAAYIVQPDGGTVRFLSMIAGAPRPGLVTPVIVEGRSPDPAAPDEVVVSEQIAEGAGLVPGTELTMRMLTLGNVADFAVGFTADGPPSRMRVVGVARMPAWGDALPDVIGGPGFALANAGGEIGRGVYVRLEDRPGAMADFTAAFAAISGSEKSLIGQYLGPTPETPRLTVAESVTAAEQALLVGIGLFALVVALGALQVTGLGLLRIAGGARESRSIEAALGMTAGESVLARLLAALPAAVLAGLLGVGVVLAAGALEPLGSQARFEPAPGFRPLWGVAIVGGLTLTAVFLLLTAVGAVVAWRRAGAAAAPELPAPGQRATALAGAAAALRRWPTVLLGSRLARSAGARRGVPPLVTILAAASAVAGIVATVVVGASLSRLIEVPARWGGASDLIIADSRAEDVDALVTDPRVAAITVAGTARLLTPSGGQLGAQSMVDHKGASPVQTVAGRLPSAPDEVAVNPRVASQLGLAEGSVLELVGPDGAPRRLTVVGEAVVPSGERERPGQDLLLTPETLVGLSGYRAPQLTAFVSAAPGAADGLAAELGERLEITPNTPPAAIRNLTDLVRLPAILAIVLAVVAGTGLAHSLLVTARRLAREMAVFSVLGATPGQVRTTLTVLAATTVVPAVLLGVPVGLGVARLLWWQVASTIGVAGDLAVPVWAIVVLVVSVPLGAAFVSVLPSLRVNRAATASALAAL